MKSTTVIALANQKGGVGKTTTAINFSACLADRRKKTLLIDLDPQANATSGLGVERGNSIYPALAGEQIPLEACIQPTAFKRLDVLPAGLDLAGAELSLAREEDYLHRLQKALLPLREKGTYDYILFDCPPSLGVLFMNALNAADEVIIPIQCEYLALEGLSVMLDIIHQVREAGHPNLHIGGILMTMYNTGTNLSLEVVEEVSSHFGDLVFKTLIPRNVRLGEAPSHGLPVIYYDRSCAGSDAYRKLAKEFLRRQKKRD